MIGRFYRADLGGETHSGPPRRARLIVAVALGLLATAYIWLFFRNEPTGSGSDFDIQWVAARALLKGHSPYEAVEAAGWAWPFYYPLPAALVSLPFSLLPRIAARALFVGLSTGILAFAVSRRGWWGLLLLLTPSFFHGFYHAQWTPLLVAALLLPPIGGLLIVKPSIGLAYFLSRPTIQAVATGTVLLVVSVIVRPEWPSEWRNSIGDSPHILAPLLRPGGFLLLLSVMYWRRPDARLLVALACIPHVTLMYETLPLFTVARTFRQMAILVIAAAIGAAFVVREVPVGTADTLRLARQWPYLLGFFYLPALATVLYNGRMAANHSPAPR